MLNITTCFEWLAKMSDYFELIVNRIMVHNPRQMRYTLRYMEVHKIIIMQNEFLLW